MRKLTLIAILLLSSTMVGLQHHAAAVKDAIHGDTDIQLLTVNINKATAEQIADVLTGVGLSKAKLIVAHRESNGQFNSLNDLLQVKGIGPATIEKNRQKVTF
jgi:competence protein ComEA